MMTAALVIGCSIVGFIADVAFLAWASSFVGPFR